MIEEADCRAEYLCTYSVVTHYLPHHLVKNDGSPTSKVRIIDDGCAKTRHKQDFE